MAHPSIEKHSFNISIGVAVMVILFLIGTTVNFASWKTSMEAKHAAMETRQDHLSNGHASMRSEIDGMEDRQDSTDITLTRVETKLVSIESLLILMREEMNR